MRTSTAVLIVAVGVVLGVSALAAQPSDGKVPAMRAPFTYEIDYARGQPASAEFRERFRRFTPDLYHAGSDLRYLGRFGIGATVLDSRQQPYEEYLEETRGYLAYLREQGARWIIPYLCNQTLSGNPANRYGAWELYDRWNEFSTLLDLGEKPSGPLSWLQREPFGALHYNYTRMVLLERGMTEDDIRFAPCPNNPDWRRMCRAEARAAARTGFDGLFIDNCIIRCYCASCERRFQDYLRRSYTPAQLEKAFGAADYGEVTLYAEGDIIQWALGDPDFLPWLEAKYPPEARRLPFDTTGPLDLEKAAHAGSGMLVGEAGAFIAEHRLKPGVRPSFEALRLANPALQTPEGRLRWAETNRFRAASIGEMLADMLKAGLEASPDFFLVPNWGVMQRVTGAAGRAEEGKDMRRWLPGGTWHMLEEGFTTGQIAPGVVLEYDLPLRYAFANGVQAMLLPYTLAGEDIAEVGLAEAAATGGHVFVATHEYPELYGRYRAFFRNHAGLYQGFQSAAQVGLVHAFDQVHYLNIEHLRQVHALNRYLADQQIPFDHLLEPDLRDLERLRAYRVILLPQVAIVDDAQLDTLAAYIAQGGSAIIVGDFATHDHYCRPRSGSLAPPTAATGRVHRFPSLAAALPHDGVYLEPAVQAAEAGGGSSEDGELRRYRYLSELDRRLWFKRYQIPGPITAQIAEIFGGNPAILDPVPASGVRSLVYERQDGPRRVMTVHLVNKNVPLPAPEAERILQPVKGLVVRLPAPSGAEVVSARLLAPGEPVSMLEVHGGGSVEIEQLGAYAVVEVAYRDTAPSRNARF